MSKMHVLCTADLHLGRSSAVAEAPNNLDLSTLGAWNRLIEVAVSEDADALIVAGDLFDGPGSYMESRKGFLNGLKTLALNQIPVIAVAGNHDWNVLPLIAREAPENFHLLGKGANWEKKRVTTKRGEILFVGWSFPNERVTASQLSGLTRETYDCPSVGILHGDTSPDSPYHPITEFELEGKVDAWVLGHIHKPGRVGANAIYPGSPQSLDFGPGERRSHGFNWLEFDQGRATFSEIIPVSSAWFEVVNLDLQVDSKADPLDYTLDHLQRKCLEICRDNSSIESVQLRANVLIRGEFPELDIEPMVMTYLDRHSIEILSIRLIKEIDPWALKDLRDVTGEAARLLIGAKALAEDADADLEIPETWIEDARRLVEQSAKDFEFQFQRSLATVSDSGESGVSVLSEEEMFEKAHSLLVLELHNVLQGALG